MTDKLMTEHSRLHCFLTLGSSRKKIILIFKIRKLIPPSTEQGQKNGVALKGTRRQAQRPELNPWNLHGRRELLQQAVL